MKKDSIDPGWYEGKIPSHSYRSLFKWGKPDTYKHPNERLVKYLMASLKLEENAFRKPAGLGLERVSAQKGPKMPEKHLQAFTNILGKGNVSVSDYDRLKAASGQAMVDILRLRGLGMPALPDVVLHPKDKEDVRCVVMYCDQNRIPLYVVGGGTSVTRGFEPVKHGAVLDVSTHMNKVLDFSETNQTVTVQPGISGPELESFLNHAPEKAGAQYAYTCGHFPQSFQFSTVGGWVVTRGAGQNSTYYGKIEDLVLSQEYVTPAGVMRTPDYPRQAMGPDADQILIGSEGIFGVLVRVTLKVFRYMPENRRYFSYLFRDWQSATDAARHILQSEAGKPSVFRISDGEETDAALRLYGVSETIADTFLDRLGFTAGKRCLMLGWADGEKGYARNVARQVNKICRSKGAFPLSVFQVTRRWEKGRFLDPYMRDDLVDFGLIIDTLECAVTWERLPKVHREVRKVIKQDGETIAMSHISHAYPQGANLYFIFIRRNKGLQDYLRTQYGILDAIVANGGSVSHHHGIGKHLAPWLAEQQGDGYIRMLRSLKQYFDPNGILNPGGTLALDLTAEQAGKQWGLNE